MWQPTKKARTNNSTRGHISRGTRHRLKQIYLTLTTKIKVMPEQQQRLATVRRNRPQDHNVRSAVTECVQNIVN